MRKRKKKKRRQLLKHAEGKRGLVIAREQDDVKNLDRLETQHALKQLAEVMEVSIGVVLENLKDLGNCKEKKEKINTQVGWETKKGVNRTNLTELGLKKPGKRLGIARQDLHGVVGALERGLVVVIPGTIRELSSGLVGGRDLDILVHENDLVKQRLQNT